MKPLSSFFQVLFLYYVGLFIVDRSGILNLYGQNMIRRLINMGRRLDRLSYHHKLDPYCHYVPAFLTNAEIYRLQSIPQPTLLDTPFFTRKLTSTHQCCQGWSKHDKEIMTEITEICRKKYEKILGKPLYPWPQNLGTFYTYYGDQSQHEWHVDPRNVDYIYNLIVCVHRTGNISPFMYKDKDGIEHEHHTQIGDAILFRGGTTVHQVPKNKDSTSKRIVLSLQFTTIPLCTKDQNIVKTMCTFIEGGNNYKHILLLWSTLFGLNWFLLTLSNVHHTNIPYSYFFTFFVLCLLVVKYVPCRIHQYHIGTGRCSSIKWNVMALLCFIVCTFSIKGAILLFTYFLLSDTFFPSSIVAYD